MNKRGDKASCRRHKAKESLDHVKRQSCTWMAVLLFLLPESTCTLSTNHMVGDAHGNT